MQPLSLKKLGKRPELHEVDGHLDIPRANRLPQSPGTVRQKRVLPSRSRRGGPGVGSCSVDIMIIDTERRTRDGKPVIPPTQPFFLTTNSKTVPPPPEPDGAAAGSYFDKPEVKAAYLAQLAIQVPEFSPLPDDAVGGRLRARAEELAAQEGPETSDLAYINRHRKYETFEKRQRRREKEKLVHEQYKLKERIEQLKGMDASAFGGGGEARRKEMLDIAVGLEMRYAVLLPPEPKRMKKNDIKRRSEGPRAGTTTGDDADAETEVEVVEPPVREVPRPASIGPRPQQVNRANTRLALHPSPASRSLAVSVALAASERNLIQPTYIPPTVSSTSPTHVRAGTGRILHRPKSEERQTPRAETTTPEVSARATDVVSAPPPRKRQRLGSQPKRHQTPDASPATTSILLQIAARKAAQPTARQTSRATLAFGYRVPPEVEDLDDFVLPEWLITRSELEHIHQTRARSATRSASPRVLNGTGKHTATVPPAVQVHQEPNGATAVDVDEPHRPALPTSSLREDNGKEEGGLESL